MGLQARYRVSQQHVRLSAHRPVSVQRTRVETPVEPHDHDYYEVCLVLSGSGVHRTPTFDRPLGRGAVVVIAPGQVHAFSEPTGLEVVNLYYLDEWLLADLRGLWDESGLVTLFLHASLFGDSPDRSVVQFDLDEEPFLRISAELRDLEEELRKDSPALHFLKVTLWKAMVLLVRECPAVELPSRPVHSRKVVESMLWEVEERLSRGEQLSIAEYAGRHGMHPDAFSRLFRQVTGLSPREYFQRRRMQAACVRLLDPTRNLTEIAHELGFSDSAHFSRRFRAFRGISPSAWRKSLS